MKMEQAIEKAKKIKWANYVFFDSLHGTFYAVERKPVKDEMDYYSLNDCGKKEILGLIESAVVELSD